MKNLNKKTEDSNNARVRCVLYPGIGVGPFKYGDKLEILSKKYNLDSCERACSSATWSTWEVHDQEIRLSFNETDKEVREGLETIGCYDHLYYQGINLFGLDLPALRTLLGKEDEIDSETYNGRRPVEFEDVGIQVWLNEYGQCDSVMCSEIIPEDEKK